MPINYLEKIQLGDFNDDGYRINPSKEVSAIIEGFYVFSRDPKNNIHLVFNDGFPVLVFLQNRDDSVSVSGEAGAYEIKAAWASAGSIKNVYVKYSANIRKLLIVRFNPGAFSRLFGLDAPYFRANPVAPFETIAGKNNFSMEEFYRHTLLHEKISFIETYAQQFFKKAGTPEILHKTLDYIHRIKGNGTVLVGTKEVDLMRTAIANGYYDSNHFLKDFKTYTGKTPLEYLKFHWRPIQARQADTWAVVKVMRNYIT